MLETAGNTNPLNLGLLVKPCRKSLPDKNFTINNDDTMYGHRLLKSVLVLVGIQSITDPVQTSPCCDHLENFNIVSYRRFSTYWTVLVDIGPENRQKTNLFEHHKIAENQEIGYTNPPTHLGFPWFSTSSFTIISCNASLSSNLKSVRVGNPPP